MGRRGARAAVGARGGAPRATRRRRATRSSRAIRSRAPSRRTRSGARRCRSRRRARRARGSALLEAMTSDAYPAVRHLAARALGRLGVAGVGGYDPSAELSRRARPSSSASGRCRRAGHPRASRAFARSAAPRTSRSASRRCPRTVSGAPPPFDDAEALAFAPSFGIGKNPARSSGGLAPAAGMFYDGPLESAKWPKFSRAGSASTSS